MAGLVLRTPIATGSGVPATARRRGEDEDLVGGIAERDKERASRRRRAEADAGKECETRRQQMKRARQALGLTHSSHFNLRSASSSSVGRGGAPGVRSIKANHTIPPTPIARRA